MRETDTDEKARTKFQEVITAGVPAASEGIRLARYFRLLAIKEKPASFIINEAEKKLGANPIVIAAATRWRADYPRFLKTPEGVGTTFLLAQVLLEEADIAEAKKNKTIADDLRTRARNLLREVERSENEFTDRARRMKIQTIVRQGGFSIPIVKLRTFEDCYMRSQFEAMKLAQEVKEAKTAADAEAKRKERAENILAALKRGMTMPEVKVMKGAAGNLELNSARAMMTYWSLNTGKLADAIAVGEAFARNDPRSTQAEMCAVYALQAYSQLIDQKKRAFEEIASERARMFQLAQYMESRWPKSLAGELARHSAGLQMLRDGNYAEAIKKLGLITPSYSNYTLVRFQLADAALKAEAEKADPIPGDRPDDYRKRAILALESMPQSALGPDPFINHIFISGKANLGRQLFKDKRYQQVDDLVNSLLPQVAKLRFNNDDEQDKKIRDDLLFQLMANKLSARWGLAFQARQANDWAKAAALLDPLVDQMANPGDTQEKTNLQKSPQLAAGMLRIALEANIRLGKTDRADLILDLLDKFAGEAEAKDATAMLRGLAVLIRNQVEEIRKKGDKDELTKAIKGFSALLDKRIKKQKTLTPEFIRYLADCYSNMGEHAKAADELGKVPVPKGALDPKVLADNKADLPDVKIYRAVQLTLIRELRMSGTADNLKKARKVMDSILGTPAKPLWGRREGGAMKEQGFLLEAEQKYSEGFNHWAPMVKSLAKTTGRGVREKEFYLEAYFHMVFCYVKLGMAKPGKVDRDKALRQAALRIVELERSWDDFGSDTSKKRFTDLLAAEPALKEQYTDARKKKR
jgi:hypothetical protein